MQKVEENARHVRDNLNDRPDATSVLATKEATMTRLLIAPEKLQGALIATQDADCRAFLDGEVDGGLQSNCLLGQRYMSTLTDPQGLKVWSERPCRHPSCFWA